MPQLSLYIDDVTMEQMKSVASNEGVSLSRYAAGAIRARLSEPVRMADEGRWERLYGCLADDDSFTRPGPLDTRPIAALDVR